MPRRRCAADLIDRGMKMIAVSRRSIGVLFGVLALVFSILATDVRAKEATLDFRADLSESEFQAMLGRLSDEQVRDILVAEFAARREEAPEPSEGIMERMRGVGEALTDNAIALIAKWPILGQGFSAVTTRLAEAGGVWLAFLALGLSLTTAFIVRHFWRSRASRRQIEIAERNIAKGSYGTFRTVLDAAFFLIIELSSSLAFALTAMATLYLFFQHPDLRLFASSYIAMITVILIVRSVVDFMFPRGWPIYRLAALSDEATRLVHLVVIGLASLWMFETTTSGVMAQFGAPEGTPDLFSLLLGVLWISSALTGIAVIHRATVELLPPETDRSLSSLLTRNWAAIMTVSQILTWMLFTGGALVSGNVDVVAAGIFSSMMIFIGFWMGYRILIHYLRAQSLNEAVKGAIARAVRSLLLAAGVLMVLAVWGLDSQALAASGSTGNVIQAVVNVTLTALVGWAAWDFLRTIIDVKVASEKPVDDVEEAEGEGGLGASRSATLLPLLRSTALVLIALLCLSTALSSLGVNVAPLIAGAGVIGLAIGFGAQTLVKDIVSGVFFLIDDAFRRGEYIDLGTVKGTVEQISVRSLQLRHHLGAVHTIPFGDIAALTNYSRDWVIMKLPLRLTFDTDPKKVKKIVKQIGAELMEDELVGEGLLEPPKSQGVIQMEDSAMILRVKFKAIPGKQFPIRRELLHRIRAAFVEHDIRFANREVTVRVQEDATEAERQQTIGAAASRAVEGT